MENKGLVSPCGLYCGVCGIYHAGANNDRALAEKLSKAYGVPAEKLVCKGCRSDTVFEYCRGCAIKSCAVEKGYEGCYQCDGFPCEKVESFPVPEGKKNILRAVPEWKRLGTEEWIKAEEKLFSCSNCGSRLFRGARKCRKCGALK
ncbi:MAG: DUF3795 domain-containing protein [Spirochaetes bacterium]|jgi:hypothetical protein|nr:DUF3795 domain-containing protein [Spirochaetota bacterium]